MQTMRQPLLLRSGARPTEKQLKEKILDYEKQEQTFKDQVANLTDEHNRMVKVFGFSENSSYYLLKPPFDKSPWLQCPWLQFDGDKANIKAVIVDSYGKMSNRPDVSCEDETNSSRFINYPGTTSTSPVMKTGFKQYWEIKSNIALNEPISEEMTLLDMGFSSKKNRDVNEFTVCTQQYYAMRLVYCFKHDKICFHVLQDRKLVEHKATNIENKKGSTASITVGILLDRDIKRLTFIDCDEVQSFKKMIIEYDNELWPMFGLCAQETVSCNMSISCGSDIDMTDEKLAMIKGA